MNFNISLTKEQLEFEEQQIESLLNHPAVKQFLLDNNLDSTFLRKNFDDFQLWIDSINRCKVCPGLQMCSNIQKGYTNTLYMDEQGFLCDALIPCTYRKKEMEQIQHRAKISKYSHMSKEDLLIDLWKINLMNEYKEYLLVYDQLTNSLNEAKGIYLYGQPGVGKSYLMKALANHYAKENRTVCFVHIPSLIQEIKNSFDDSEYQRKIMRDIQQCDVLFMDDIGSEAISEWQRDNIIYTILAYRDDNKKKTYFSSNYALQELEVRYTNKDAKNGKVPANRIYNRIQSLSKEISLKGKSRR